MPTIPVKQIECNANSKPTVIDGLFDGFDKTNGFEAFSLTIYNKTEKDAKGNPINSDSDLPVFHAETIVTIQK